MFQSIKNKIAEVRYHYDLWYSLARYAVENFQKDRRIKDKLDDLDYMAWYWKTSKMTLDGYIEFFDTMDRINGRCA